MKTKVLITGAGGFIGGHLVKSLLEDGHCVNAVDCKPFDNWHQLFEGSNNTVLDLTSKENCDNVADGIDHIYNLACDMGGIGFIENHKLDCMSSVLINTQLLRSAIKKKVSKYFFSSTACVYNKQKQSSKKIVLLKEEDAYPCLPEDGYGWEKLFSENFCLEAFKANLIETKVARLHNVYGPFGTWFGGREKAPAAMCRKVAMVQLNKSNHVDIWGDGEQMRSFMHINDCVYGIKKIMNSDIKEPINLGSSEVISINNLVNIIEKIAGFKVCRKYNINEPIGVMSRGSDNTKIKNLINWEPKISIEKGLRDTYAWIYQQCKKQY